MRNEALAWLQADLAAWSDLLEKGPEEQRANVLPPIQHWLQDSDLNGVRDPAALAKLPQAERQQWEKLWHDVETLRQRAADLVWPRINQIGGP